MSKMLDPRSVTIFGGGIAGLTAAHELAERGFRVEVWEKDGGERAGPGRSELGGMARTQWTHVERPTWVKRPDEEMKRTKPVVRLDEEIYFAPGAAVPRDPEETRNKLAAVAAKLKERPELEVDIGGFAVTPDKDLSRARAEHVRSQLVEVHGVQNPEVEKGRDGIPGRYRLEIWALGDAHAPERPSDQRDYVGFHPRQRVLPGEHGFRFFPAFYWHVFDTMKRTPILESVPRAPVEAARRRAYFEKYPRLPGRVYQIETRLVETPRTVYDNLVSTTTQAIIGEREGAPALIPRRRLRSFEATWRALHALLATMGYTLEDIRRFDRKLFKYMTSSSARREQELESISWWDFFEGDRCHLGFQESMDSWPQALVAMTAQEGDARTQAGITVQLLLDQLADVQYRDGTLNGPTSEAWFDPWRQYLEVQRVAFVHGELQGIELKEGDVSLKLHRFDGKRAGAYDGYYLIALPLLEAKRLVTRDLVDAYERAHPPDPSGGPRDETLRRIHEFPVGDLDKAHPTGALQHLSGIQYYFAEDVQWVDGHTYYPESEWGLSSISQAIFWREKHDISDGYRGTLSVCIANWYKKSRRTGKCAWESSPEELAREVWCQIVRGLRQRSERPRAPLDRSPPTLPFAAPPEPLYYHIDSSMVFKEDGSGVLENKAPLLINRPGEWRLRPGDPGRYQVYFDRLVFAGTYMKTYTRLTTMEAANESARHAVNAILLEAERAAPTGRAGNLCSIWPLEEREIEDLRFLRDLDARLVKRGLPHLLDILGLAGPNATLLEVGLTRPPGSSLDALRQIAGAIDGALGEQLRALMDALTSTPA